MDISHIVMVSERSFKLGFSALPPPPGSGHWSMGFWQLSRASVCAQSGSFALTCRAGQAYRDGMAASGEFEVAYKTDSQILACNAPQDRHEAIRAYVARTQCRGSAGPRIAGEIIQEVWDLAAKGTRKDYMQCLEERGFPVLI